MTDTIIKGTGNSRTLKTVPNALTLYPNFEAMIAAMVDGSFPIDLGPLQTGGINVKGTDLNKAALLSDSTESTIWGNTGNRTVDAALEKLRSLISTAQSTATSANSNANGRARYDYGNFTGSSGGTKSLYFTSTPRIIILCSVDGSIGVAIYNANKIDMTNPLGTKSITFGATAVTLDSWFNSYGTKWFYFVVM